MGFRVANPQSSTKSWICKISYFVFLWCRGKRQTFCTETFTRPDGGIIITIKNLSFFALTCSMCLLRVHFLLKILAQWGQTMPSTLWCLLMCDVRSAASWPHWGQGRFWRPATWTFSLWMFKVVLVANCWSQSGHFLTRDGMLNTGLSFLALESFVGLEFSFSSGMFTWKHQFQAGNIDDVKRLTWWTLLRCLL